MSNIKSIYKFIIIAIYSIFISINLICKLYPCNNVLGARLCHRLKSADAAVQT